MVVVILTFLFNQLLRREIPVSKVMGYELFKAFSYILPFFFSFQTIKDSKNNNVMLARVWWNEHPFIPMNVNWHNCKTYHYNEHIFTISTITFLLYASRMVVKIKWVSLFIDLHKVGGSFSFKFWLTVFVFLIWLIYCNYSQGIDILPTFLSHCSKSCTFLWFWLKTHLAQNSHFLWHFYSSGILQNIYKT